MVLLVRRVERVTSTLFDTGSIRSLSATQVHTDTAVNTQLRVLPSVSMCECPDEQGWSGAVRAVAERPGTGRPALSGAFSSHGSEPSCGPVKFSWTRGEDY